MAKSRDIKRRIKSVKNTAKITRTMELIATAKAKTAQDRIQKALPYFEALAEIAGQARKASGDDQGVVHPLLERREVKKVAVLAVVGNRGLCGGYNTNLAVTARNLLKEERAGGATIELHAVGKRGIQYFRHRGETMAGAHDKFGDKVGFAEVNTLAEDFIRRYSAREIDKVVVVYQKFFSAGRQRPVAEVLLPLDAASAVGAGAQPAADGPRADRNYIYSPDPASLLRELLPTYVKTSLWTDFLQAAAGEHLARMVAMKNATDAADKLIRALTRAYNRARQTQITNEIAELMGGVEALK